MTDITKLSAADILKIPVDKPELLYTGDASEAKLEYRKLAKLWHPDAGSGRDDVFQHLKQLYEQVDSKLSGGTWKLKGKITFTSKTGSDFEVKYRSHSTFELGDIYVGDSFVAYAITRENDDLTKIAIDQIKNFKYADEKMKKEIERFMPSISFQIETETHQVLIIKKTPDLLILSDVIAHFKGKIPPRHATWIISRLYHLSCYLKYLGVTHPSIQPDSIFISPEYHTACLLGGWWYAVPTGKKLIAAPGRTVDLLPSDLLRKPIADLRINQELVRSVGREMLGDVHGSKLLYDKDIPKALTNWLKQGATDNAYKEYDTWLNKVCLESWGPRKFVELDLTADDIY